MSTSSISSPSRLCCCIPMESSKPARKEPRPDWRGLSGRSPAVRRRISTTSSLICSTRFSVRTLPSTTPRFSPSRRPRWTLGDFTSNWWRFPPRPPRSAMRSGNGPPRLRQRRAIVMDPLAAVRVILKGDVVVASLEGEVDLSNARDIREDILGSIPNTATGLILDLTNTSYLDSQGIQVLLDVTELLGVRHQRIRLIVPKDALIRQVLSLTSLLSALALDQTMEDALATSQAADLKGRGA